MVGFCEHGSKTTGSVKCGNLSSHGTVGFLRRTVRVALLIVLKVRRHRETDLAVDGTTDFENFAHRKGLVGPSP